MHLEYAWFEVQNKNVSTNEKREKMEKMDLIY